MHRLNLQNGRRWKVSQEHTALDLRLDDIAVYPVAQVWMWREHARLWTGPRVFWGIVQSLLEAGTPAEVYFNFGTFVMPDSGYRIRVAIGRARYRSLCTMPCTMPRHSRNSNRVVTGGHGLSFSVFLVGGVLCRSRNGLGGTLTGGLLVGGFLRSFGSLSLLMATIMELLVGGLFLHASVSHSARNLAMAGEVQA